MMVRIDKGMLTLNRQLIVIVVVCLVSFPGSLAQAAPGASPKPATQVKKRVDISADFRDVSQAPPTKDCAPLDACAELLGSDAQTVVGTIESLTVSDDKISVLYSADAGAAQPVYIRLSRRKTLDYIYDFVPEKPAATKPDVVKFEQAIAGDFCQKDENCICTTALLHPDCVSGNQCASFPRGRTVNDWQKGPEILADVLDSTGTPQKATLESLSIDTAVVSFTVSSGFKPASLVFYTAANAYAFAYTPAQPIQVGNLNYTADDLSSVCDLYTVPLNMAATQTCGDRACTVTLQKSYLGAVGDKVSVANTGTDLDCTSCEVTAINSTAVTYSSGGSFSGAVAGGNLVSPSLDCMNTKPEHLQLKPLGVGADVGFVAMTDKLLVARVRAPMGLEPTALIVTNTNACNAVPPATCSFPPKSTIVRRTTKPGQNDKLLNVNMTIMDQITAQRNYGNRIAKRYIAVTLDVTNPTSSKVQFNKSAAYFDVDYVESKERHRGFQEGFKEGILTISTLGLYQPSVYNPPFVAGRKDGKPPRVARFGLEQNVRHSPVNYLSVLGSFDYTTSKTDDDLKYLELIGSVLSNIATGGLVADTSGAFRAGTSVFSGTFLPGVRGLVLNTSYINRLRSNLVAQTLQETIQVSARGSTSTIVLLPRAGILAFTDAEVPVMVSRVIDVHLDEEVVTPVQGTTVKKGQCTLGNTKDQTRQALGEPTGATTAADNTSTFTYSKGPVASVAFDTAGKLQSCKMRSASEQLDQATTLAEASQTLTDLGLTSTKLALTDGSTILVDIPGVQNVYRFDTKGARLSDYTLLFEAITSEKGAKKVDFDAFLENKAQPLSATRSKDIKDYVTDAGKSKKSFDTTFTYKSPDLQDGQILIKFKKGATETSVDDKTSTVDSINFAGAKPKSIN